MYKNVKSDFWKLAKTQFWDFLQVKNEQNLSFGQFPMVRFKFLYKSDLCKLAKTQFWTFGKSKMWQKKTLN